MTTGAESTGAAGSTSPQGSSSESLSASDAFSGVTSFDEMEAITEKQVSEKKSASKVDKDLGLTETGEEEGKENAKTEKKDQDKDPEDAANKKDGKEEKKPDDKKPAGKNKNFKFKNGDADLEVPSAAKMTVVIDGKPEEFTLEEVANEFSGKTNWGRKYQELDTERKSFNNERTALDESINQLHDLAVTKNQPMKAIALLANLLGGDGIKVMQDLQSRMMTQYEEWSKLSPEERSLKQEQEKNALLQEQIDGQKTAEAKKATQGGIAKRVEDVKAKHNITDARFTELYDALKESVKPEDLTPELIGDVHVRWVQMDQVDEIVSELKIEDQTAKKALLDEWQKDKSLTAAQIKLIAKELYTTKKPSGGSPLKNKIERNGSTTNQPAPKTPKQTADLLSFEDLE